MTDTPLDLTGDAEGDELTVENVPRYAGIEEFDPLKAEDGDVWFSAPSMVQSLSPENVLSYLQGEKTLAEVYGVTMLDLYGVAELGVKFQREAKLQDARKVFELLVALNPKHGWFRNLLGVSFLSFDMPEQAQMQFEKAVELDPGLGEAWANLAELSFRANDLAQAKTQAEQALFAASDGKSEAAAATARALLRTIESEAV
ncbi:MAG: tetratricopeptide repeat protein [Myxococcota bacterium]